MILSFHPCFVGDQNILCAGRAPDSSDQAAIAQADAVILPQGCTRALHDMARRHCTRVFPDYRARFEYPGKTGQARLFKDYPVDHPATLVFSGVAALSAAFPGWRKTPPVDLPFVFKFDWGGQGESVFLVETVEALTGLVARSAEFEQTGQTGFLFQQYVPSRNRSLRVAVIGTRMVTYWRVQDDAARFHANLADGGRIDRLSDPDLQAIAARAVGRFCGRTGINLAGFDLLFPDAAGTPSPVFLEINWFFGRRGLGGSENYYKLLTEEIALWLRGITGPNT